METDEYGADRSIGISSDLAKRLRSKDEDLLELSNDVIPLRGWAQIDKELNGNEIVLPVIFANVLGIQKGSSVKLRSLAQITSI